MNYPLTVKDRFRQIAIETARMSYPGSMSRGRKPVVRAGTKKRIEEFFSSDQFALSDLTLPRWSPAAYGDWHGITTGALADRLATASYVAGPDNNPSAVAAKFLDTFMHQLMKYSEFRPVLPHLHLALDRRVLGRLKALRYSPPAREISGRVGGQSPYSISYDDYRFVQGRLWELVAELNERRGMEFQISSRIELNLLWL